jgi:hypothetical protein
MQVRGSLKEPVQCVLSALSKGPILKVASQDAASSENPELHFGHVEVLQVKSVIRNPLLAYYIVGALLATQACFGVPQVLWTILAPILIITRCPLGGSEATLHVCSGAE